MDYIAGRYDVAVIGGGHAGCEAAVAAAAELMNAPTDLLDKSVFPTFVEEEVSQEDVTTAIDRMIRYDLLTADNAPKPEELLS